MWPYNDDEAGWLKPRERTERPRDISANDNDPDRRVSPRSRSPAAPTPLPKS